MSGDAIKEGIKKLDLIQSIENQLHKAQQMKNDLGTTGAKPCFGFDK